MTITVDSFKGKTVLVLGLARSGLSAAHALRSGGARVLVWDDGAAARDRAKADGFEVCAPADAVFDRLIASPGVPLTHPAPHPAVLRAGAIGATVGGDIDLLYGMCPDAAYIGITGTNGKSTTTALIGHIFESAGLAASVGGNLGTAALDLAPRSEGETFVLETSSYQLDLIGETVFNIAILLNISPDHLDRHGGMDGYVRAKQRIFRNQRAGDTAIIGVDDAWCRKALADRRLAPGRVVPVSVTAPVDGGVYATGGRLIDTMDGPPEPVMRLADAPRLPGLHNAQNIAAAYAACRRAGIARETIVEAIKCFPGLPHRQFLVAEQDGIAFINDSKATNAEAAARALACYDRIYWIAGGREKEGGYGPLTPYLGNIRHAFLIGEATGSIDRFLAGHVDAEDCGDLETAVKQAFALARREGGRGSVILLSPACASFDQFSSFEERGAAFERAVAAEIAESSGAGR